MTERPATSADWLDEGRRLGPPPRDLVAVRERVHGIVTNVMTPARYRQTGRIAMRWTPGGLGSPFFERDGADTQIRIEGNALIVQVGDNLERHDLTTIGAATRVTIGQDEPDMQWTRDLDLHDIPPTLTPDTDVAVSADAMAYLSDWFGLAFSVLQRLQADEESTEASEPQLWPEHLDPAIEILPGKQRASYGFSPGDGSSDEPYVYVSIWYPDEAGVTPGDGHWNAPGYVGAVLKVSEFVGVDDQAGFVLEWLRRHRDLLRQDQRG